MKLCYPCFGCVVKMMITCVCKSMSDCGGLFITTGGVNTGSSPKILVHVKILLTHFLLFHFSKNKTHRTIVGNSLFCNYLYENLVLGTQINDYLVTQ